MNDRKKAVRVVVVDDASCVRERLTHRLSRINGVEVVGAAGDVPTGLALVREFQPDVVMLDLDLPGQSGIDFLKLIEQQEAGPLIVMLTNVDHPQARRKCLELGADYYFYKFQEFEEALDICRELAVQRVNPIAMETAFDKSLSINGGSRSAAETFADLAMAETCRLDGICCQEDLSSNTDSVITLEPDQTHVAEFAAAGHELLECLEPLQALAAHLQSAREDERKRIAREIHDELGQSLTGFKMELAWMLSRLKDSGDVSALLPVIERIAALDGLLDNMVGMVQRLCTELRPGVLDDLGLSAAIESHAGEFQRRTGIHCDLKLELGDLSVDDDRSTALFRIFQEVLTNVTRHAGASEVKVLLKKAGPNLFMEVSDNGRGIVEDRKTITRSLGLLGMRERAAVLGGDVEIESRAGNGTVVRVRLPLPQAIPAAIHP